MLTELLGNYKIPVTPVLLFSSTFILPFSSLSGHLVQIDAEADMKTRYFLASDGEFEEMLHMPHDYRISPMI